MNQGVCVTLRNERGRSGAIVSIALAILLIAINKGINRIVSLQDRKIPKRPQESCSHISSYRPVCETASLRKANCETASLCKANSETASPCKANRKTASLCKANCETASTRKANDETVSPCKANRETASPCKANHETASPCKANRETASPCKANSETMSPCKANRETASPCKANRETASLRKANRETASPCKANSETVNTLKPGRLRKSASDHSDGLLKDYCDPHLPVPQTWPADAPQNQVGVATSLATSGDAELLGIATATSRSPIRKAADAKRKEVSVGQNVLRETPSPSPLSPQRGVCFVPLPAVMTTYFESTLPASPPPTALPLATRLICGRRPAHRKHD
ncbi:tumor necrosis factor receptor superfamily member 1A-like [Anolis sagrei]|uniref:tumor necrosis factor receptor superfamily member 1A-like n=1 Tax=Anolis sagrei TaxID=38937 RepID=UPI00352285BE